MFRRREAPRLRTNPTWPRRAECSCLSSDSSSCRRSPLVRWRRCPIDHVRLHQSSAPGSHQAQAVGVIPNRRALEVAARAAHERRRTDEGAAPQYTIRLIGNLLEILLVLGGLAVR